MKAFLETGNIEYKRSWRDEWLKMECRRIGTPMPAYDVTASDVMVTLKPLVLTPPVAPPVTPQVTPPVESGLDSLLNALRNESLGSAGLLKVLGLKDRNHFRKAYLRPALEKQWIEQVLPDKPHSRFQKYRLTATGRARLEQLAHQSRLAKLKSRRYLGENRGIMV